MVAHQDIPRPRVAIFLQDKCREHKFIRHKDISTIVERPERLRAVNVGLAAAIARLEEVVVSGASTASSGADDLAAQLDRLAIKDKSETKADETTLASALSGVKLEASEALVDTSVVHVVKSNSRVDLLAHPAVDWVHADKNAAACPLRRLRALVAECEEKLRAKESEIPANLPQGDLYRASSAPA